MIDFLAGHTMAVPQAYYILVAAMGIDIVTGLAAAWGTKTLSSSVSWRGIMKKISTLMVVALAVLITPLVPGEVPLGTLSALGFIVSESLSILENAGRLGVLPPFALKDALIKLAARDGTEVVMKASAERVEVHVPIDAIPGGQRLTDPPVGVPIVKDQVP